MLARRQHVQHSGFWKTGAGKIVAAALWQHLKGKEVRNSIKILRFSPAQLIKLNSSGYIVPGLGDAGDRLLARSENYELTALAVWRNKIK
jgi:hypothetical protein